MSKAEKKEEEIAEEETKSTEVAVKEESTAVAEVAPEEDFDFDADSGQGMEDMTAEDIQIPRINIIQSLSPQRSQTKPEYIEGCTEGQIFENGDKQLWDGGEGILVIPIKFQKSFLEWAPRDTGKGLVNHHGSDDTAYKAAVANDKGQRMTADGNEIIPTAEYFLFVVDEKTKQFTPFVLSMSKSALKHARRWNLIGNRLTDAHPKAPDRKKAEKTWKPPFYYGMYRLKTVPESNNQGEWFRWEIAAEGNIRDFFGEDKWKGVYGQAKAFWQTVDSGDVKVREPVESDHQDGDESDDDPM